MEHLLNFASLPHPFLEIDILLLEHYALYVPTRHFAISYYITTSASNSSRIFDICLLYTNLLGKTLEARHIIYDGMEKEI